MKQSIRRSAKPPNELDAEFVCCANCPDFLSSYASSRISSIEKDQF